MYTPTAKPPPKDGRAIWRYVSGAKHDESREEYAARRDRQALPIPYEVDLHAVAFHTPEGGLPAEDGFAGGSEESEGSGDERVPVIYRYDEEEGGWERDASFEAQAEGYVAEIAWLSDERALAVGGDGAYPHREQPNTFCEPGEAPPYEDPSGAGSARVWLYDSGSWRELEAGADFPAEMGALTALDAYDARQHSMRGVGREGEFAVAGGLCQLWNWSHDADGAAPSAQDGFLRVEDGSGAFESPFSAADDPDLAYRVRSLNFEHVVAQVALEELEEGVEPPTPRIEGVTAGCCEPLDTGERPQAAATLSYDVPDAPDDMARGAWSATSAGDGNPELAPDSGYSVTATRFVSDQYGSTGGSGGTGYILTPGGPSPNPADTEPSSWIAKGIRTSPNPNDYEPSSSSLRLLDGGGDVGGGSAAANVQLPPLLSEGTLENNPVAPPDPTVGGESATRAPDGLPDWAVGELTGSGRGAILGTDPDQLPPPPTAVEATKPFASRSDSCPPNTSIFKGDPGHVTCNYIDPLTTWPGDAVEEGYEPTNQDRAQAALRSWKLLTLDTAPLNAIDVLDDDGVGWAVGDNGTLLKVTVESSANVGDEPPAPKLGDGEQAPPDSSPYERFSGPGGGEPGPVPPFGAELDPGAGPSLVSYGSPNPTGPHKNSGVAELVMSRDGSEGWAVGDGRKNGSTSLFHFDGNSWRRCEIPGTLGLSEPDPECEGLAALAEEGTRLVAAARVPMENDDDPTNDDEFEVVAIGAGGEIVRYRAGRWAIEAEAGTVTVRGEGASLAFTAPDDGWFFTASGNDRFFHRFDGSEWVECNGSCGGGGRLSPWGESVRPQEVVAAGERVFLVGRRVVRAGNFSVEVESSYPFILYKERGEEGWHGSADGSDGGYDPAFGHTEEGQDPPPAGVGGSVGSLSVTTTAPGLFRAWATGRFGSPAASTNAVAAVNSAGPRAKTAVMRLDSDGQWEHFHDSGSLRDLQPSLGAASAVGTEAPTTVIADQESGVPYRLHALDPDRDAFEALPSDRRVFRTGIEGVVQALAADGAGGVWAAVRARTSSSSANGVFFYRYTPRPAKPVLPETASPISNGDRTITGLAGAEDGTVWAATDASELYRYDRITGWDKVTIPGWETGRVVTNPSPVNAIALAPDGEGLAVGRSGRIARIGDSVSLDPAAGTSCAAQPLPCGTTRDLLAVDVSAGGAAIAGGEGRALVWRPAGEEFRAIEPPRVPRSTDFIGVAIAAAGRVWAATAEGKIYAGSPSPRGRWSWRLENVDGEGELLSLGPETSLAGERLALSIRDMDLDESGRGYAVGDNGLILERTGDEELAWRRVDSGYEDDLSVVALAVGGGPGALIGGRGGVVLTRASHGFALARAPQFSTRWSTFPTVKGAVLVPGTAPGEAEAWVTMRPDDLPEKPKGALGPSRLFHYASDPLLDASANGVGALPDSPPATDGELSLAAFGKSDCRLPVSSTCSDAAVTGAAELSAVLRTRIRDEILARSKASGGPQLSLFTGDAVDATDAPAASELRDQLGGIADDVSGLTGVPLEGGKLHSWRAQVADPLTDSGIPLLGTIGSQDLSETRACDDAQAAGGIACASTKEHAEAGDNLTWREEMADQFAPRGSGDEVAAGALELQPVEDSDLSVRHQDVEVEAEAADTEAEKTLNTGGASTHYAVDVIDNSRAENQEVARIVFADNSLRSLAASDPIQQPFEPDGQLQWLEKVLCIKGTTNATQRCTREPHQQAIVVANTPTYSYGPGSGTDTATDATLFETTLMRHKVNLVVSGRIGWNGLYYALAPGLHEPCPGGEYPGKPPKAGQGLCGQDIPTGASVPSPEEVAGAATELAADTSGIDTTKPLPFVVASSAGGNLANESDTAEADDGYWQGYTIIRLHPSGDPRKMVVEQRPVYDWIAIEASQRVLNPRQKMPLGGYARAPIEYDTQGPGESTRFDRIHSPAVTHRYDLLLADPKKPWVPLGASDATPAQLSAAASYPDPLAGPGHSESPNPCEPYVCLDPEVAKVDDQAGVVKAGGGNHPGTFAIATLSVGDHVATYPLYFESSPSFRAQPPVAPRPDFANAAVAAPGTPSIPSVPQIPSVSTPNIPTPPALVPPPPAPPATPPQPPVPPPVPPADAGPSPLSLSFAPSGLVVAPTASVIPPPAPPINPAPPGGARREARQRQAATQKSGADNAESDSQAQDGGGDLAQDGPDRMVRRDRVKPGQSFTPLAREGQPSAWATGALYGGGITIMAFALAAGWTRGRPTPRRRQPELPAPALSENRRRR